MIIKLLLSMSDPEYVGLGFIALTFMVDKFRDFYLQYYTVGCRLTYLVLGFQVFGMVWS
jgi:hypothetical protein